MWPATLLSYPQRQVNLTVLSQVRSMTFSLFLSVAAGKGIKEQRVRERHSPLPTPLHDRQVMRKLTHSHNFRGISPHLCQEGRLYCAAWAGCRPALLSAIAGERQEQLSHSYDLRVNSPTATSGVEGWSGRASTHAVIWPMKGRARSPMLILSGHFCRYQQDKLYFSRQCGTLSRML